VWASNCLLNSSEAIGDLDGMEQGIGYFVEVLALEDQIPNELSVAERTKRLRRLIIEELLATNDNAVPDYTIATQTAALGWKEETMAHLEASYLSQDMLLPFAAADPAFDLLADEPRFQQLIENLGLGAAAR